MSAGRDRPWRAAPDGLLVEVRATPRGGRDRIEGVVRDAEDRPALALRVSAPPEGGKANAAVTALLAKALGLPKSAVQVVQGATARRKRLAVSGDPEALAAALEALIRK